MPTAKAPASESGPTDRLPADWRERIASFDAGSAAHYRRVMKTLATFEWMEPDERERAAFVIVDKEQLRLLGHDGEDD